MNELNLEQLTKPEPPKLERIELPGLGGFVFARQLNGLEHLEVEVSTRDFVKETGGDENRVFWTSSVIAKSVCGEDGKPKFQTREQAEAFLQKPLPVISEFLNRILIVAGYVVPANAADPAGN